MPLNRRLITIATTALALGTGHLTLAASLIPFDATYTLSSGTTIVGETRLTLEHYGEQTYRYTSSSRATGFIGRLVGGNIEERSEGSFSSDQIRPAHYIYRRTGRKEREVLLEFDWLKAQVINTINEDPWVMAIPSGTLDKLAVQLALMLDLDQGRQAMNYHIADGGTLKDYHFKVAGRETIETPLGLVETIRIKRDRGHAERYTEFWCAPQWGYAPVRIVQYRKGAEHARLSLRKITVGEVPSRK